MYLLNDFHPKHTMESENSTTWKTNSQDKKWAKDLNSLPNTLACPSCYNEIPQTRWLQQQTFMICYVKHEENDGISCSNSTRMIKVLTHSVPGESCHSSLWPAASHFIIIWSFLSISRVVVIVLSCSKSTTEQIYLSYLCVERKVWNWDEAQLQTDFFLGSQITADGDCSLKDTCSLEGMLW